MPPAKGEDALGLAGIVDLRQRFASADRDVDEQNLAAEADDVERLTRNERDRSERLDDFGRKGSDAALRSAFLKPDEDEKGAEHRGQTAEGGGVRELTRRTFQRFPGTGLRRKKPLRLGAVAGFRRRGIGLGRDVCREGAGCDEATIELSIEP